MNLGKNREEWLVTMEYFSTNTLNIIEYYFNVSIFF